jgi:ankyrin repeat protein
MDPVSALSLAGNILQFVELSAKLVSKGNAIFNSANGTLEENDRLEVVSSRLREHSLDLGRSISTPHTQNELALVAICRSCIDIVDELLQKLSCLAVQGNITRFKSYRQALKSVWHKDAINDLASKLELFRGELNTCLLLSIRYSVGDRQI